MPPFILAAGSPLKYNGINSVGLKRRDFSIDDRNEIKNIYKIYFRSKESQKSKLEQINSSFSDSQYKSEILKFISNSERGII